MICTINKITLLYFVFILIDIKGQTINGIIHEVANDREIKIESALNIYALVDSRWRSNPPEAIKICDSLIAIGESTGNTQMTILGNILYASEVNDIGTVEKHLSQASFLVKENIISPSNAVLTAYIEFLWGNYFQHKKSYWAIALQHLYKAELLLIKHPSPLLEKVVKMELLSVTYNCSQFEVTIKQCFELINKKKSYKLLDEELVLIYNALGLSYSTKGQFDKSRFFFNNAFQYIKGDSTRVRFWNTLIKSNMANEFKHQKEYANYIPLFKKDVINCKIMQDYESLIFTYITLAKACLAANLLKESSQYLDSAQYISHDKHIVLHPFSKMDLNSISIEIDLAKQDYSHLKDKVAKLILLNDTTTIAHSRRMGETSYLLAKASIMEDEFAQNNMKLQSLEFQKREQRNIIIFFALLAAGVFLSIYFWIVQKNIKKTLSLNIELNQAQTMKKNIESELTSTKIELQKLSEEVELKKKQLISQSVNIVQKNETINEIKGAIKKIKNLQSESSLVKAIITGAISRVNQNHHLEKEWELFRLQFEEISPGFFAVLKAKFPELSEADLRFCALFKLNLNSNQISGLLNITPESVKAARHRLRKKMKLSPNQNIHEFLTSNFN